VSIGEAVGVSLTFVTARLRQTAFDRLSAAIIAQEGCNECSQRAGEAEDEAAKRPVGLIARLTETGRTAAAA
jgi:hypothetical protein